MPAIGRNVPRKEGNAKVTGAALYVDDLRFPDMLHARTIRAPVARGTIGSVHFEFPTTGFVVADFRDIPGRNIIALIEDDQPCLAEREVRHAEEPILLLAHADREQLWQARVQVEIAASEPQLDPRASRRVFKEITIRKGDVEAGFAEADLIVADEYRTGHQEHIYIEPQGMIAVPQFDANDQHPTGVTIYGSLQCPYYAHRALCTLLGLEPGAVRVIQTETGGGFGGKEEYPSMIAGHAALLALKSRRPVKLIYDRLEDMAATTKRHPSIVRHRTGVTRAGLLTAIDVEVLLDGGAYCTLSPVVLSRGCIHASGPYRCANVRVHGKVVGTDSPPNGAFRGFGAPQTIFAVEAHMDRVAAKLGLDPVRLRELNALRPGDTTATGQKLGRDTSALKVLHEAVRRTDFQRRRKALAGTPRGLGLALYFHGAGFTGGGEVKLASKAGLELTERGARILVASTEIGQGTRTMHAQIVADALAIPYDRVEVAEADTGIVPDSGPTVASRTCMVVGRILEQAALEMKRRLRGLSHAEYLRRHGPLVIVKQYEPPGEISWSDETYRGDAYGTYAWACDVVELEVDPVTYEARPLKVTVVAEIGKAIHPGLVQGQLEGGTAQGLGFALLERVEMRDGRMSNAQLTNYIVPTTLDTPPMEIVVLEAPYKHGPHGAKGVGELPMDGPAPAVVNALRHIGIDLREVPALPERIAEALNDEASSTTGWSTSR